MICGYLLQRNADGKFVAVSGSPHSYTRDVREAVIYAFREDALRNACENETVVTLRDVMRGAS